MRVRAIKDLSQLSDPDFFKEVSRGLDLCLENSKQLYASHETLGQNKHPQGADILKGLAEEEVAKFLILLDAVRCPRNPADLLAQHLGKFNNHLARLLYAYACNLRSGASDYGTLIGNLNEARASLYLDGPNDADYIFRNDLLHQRESAMYVDYIETDEGHSWLCPNDWHTDLGQGFLPHKPMVIELVETLAGLGFTNADALKAIAARWRGIAMRNDYSFAKSWPQITGTLQDLEKLGLIKDSGVSRIESILSQWQFPLYGAELNSEIQVNREDLRERQRNWSPF